MKHLKPPYYMVIFSYTKSDNQDGYQTMSTILNKSVEDIDGFFGVEDYSNEQEHVSISYWKDKEAIDDWRNDIQHIMAKIAGKMTWYKEYSIKIAKVEQSY